MDISKIILFSDMDGTLLTTDKRISETNMAAIRRFTGLGGRFTIATGRTIQSFGQFVELLGLEMPVIMYNGAGIYDYGKGELLYCAPMPDDVRGMVTEIMRLMPECGGEVLSKNGTYVFNNTEYQQLHTRLCGISPEYMDISEIPDGDWMKVLFCLAPEDVPNLQLLVKQLGYCERLDFVKSSDIFLEMLPKGISKGSALKEYRKLPGMEDFTFVAIGDFDNDIEMIEKADIGVCPANAEDAVKSSADMILTKTNDEDAVAELIDHLINKSNF